MIKTANQKERKLRTRQDRPTNKQIIAELGIPQWKFYGLKRKGIISNDMTVEEIRGILHGHGTSLPAQKAPAAKSKTAALYGKQTVKLIISGIPTESLAQLLVELQGMKHFEVSSVKVEFE